MISDMCRIMDKIHNSLEWLKRDNKALRGEMANLQLDGEISALQQEMEELRVENEALREEIGGVRV